MRIHIIKLRLPTITSLKPNIKENIYYLSYFGKYEIIQNKIFLFKIQNTDEQLINQYLKNTDIIVSHEQWKKYKEEFYLPKDHIPIKCTLKIYNLTSKLKFIIEIVDEDIIDYYFDTTYTLDNFHLKEELNSFLHNFKTST